MSESDRKVAQNDSTRRWLGDLLPSSIALRRAGSLGAIPVELYLNSLHLGVVERF